jgi:hypothetical protein
VSHGRRIPGNPKFAKSPLLALLKLLREAMAILKLLLLLLLIPPRSKIGELGGKPRKS